MAAKDVLAKLGGQSGQEGGLATISKLLNSNGGLQGIMSKLNQNGMGQQLQSWLGSGHNEPVSGSEVRQALDADSINQVAERTGMPPEQASEQIARVLPEMVDHATPHGQMPMEDPFSQGPESLKGLIAH